MAQYPANRRDAQGFIRTRFIGNPATILQPVVAGARFARFSSDANRDTASVPVGYGTRGAQTLARIGGERIASSGNEAAGVGTATGAIGLNGDAAGAGSASGAATGQAIFPGTGTGAATGSGTAAGIGVAFGSALGSAVATGTVTGAGAAFGSAAGGSTSSGTALARANAFGSASNVTDDPLSPDSLADAVWAKTNSNGDPYGAVVTNAEKQAKLAVALSA